MFSKIGLLSNHLVVCLLRERLLAVLFFRDAEHTLTQAAGMECLQEKAV